LSAPRPFFTQHDQVWRRGVDLKSNASTFDADGAWHGLAQSDFVSVGKVPLPIFPAENENSGFEVRYDHDTGGVLKHLLGKRNGTGLPEASVW
jgi:hypothetical protein